MRGLLLILFSITLAGCFTAGKRGGDSGLVVYDLGLAAQRLPDASILLPLALEIRAPLWFDTLGIEYRLFYNDASRLREYARARWAGPPAQLIQQRLMQKIGYSSVGQGRSLCMLRFEITEFSQVFVSPESSKGVLQGRVQWLNRSRQPLFELRLDIEKSAPSEDARGGVSALQATVEQLGMDMLDWQKQMQLAGKASECSR